jgi:hypothetical protein
MEMSEGEAADAILRDFGVPIEIFQKYPSTITVANGYASILLDWAGSYRRWAHRHGYEISSLPQFGIGKPGSVQRQFYDEQISPLMELQRTVIKTRL